MRAKAAANMRKLATRHGWSGHPLYYAWRRMLDRCHNPEHPDFRLYGARGIVVCDEWRNDFMVFVQHMGKRPTRAHTLDRIDNNGPYSPKNCRWATPLQQALNTRRNRRYEAFGKALTVGEWSAQVGIPPEIIRQRVARDGWTIERALTTPTHRA